MAVANAAKHEVSRYLLCHHPRSHARVSLGRSTSMNKGNNISFAFPSQPFGATRSCWQQPNTPKRVPRISRSLRSAQRRHHEASKGRPARTRQTRDHTGYSSRYGLVSKTEHDTTNRAFSDWNFSLSSATMAALSRSFWSRSPFDATSSALSSVSLASSCRRATNQSAKRDCFRTQPRRSSSTV